MHHLTTILTIIFFEVILLKLHNLKYPENMFFKLISVKTGKTIRNLFSIELLPNFVYINFLFCLEIEIAFEVGNIRIYKF